MRPGVLQCIGWWYLAQQERKLKTPGCTKLCHNHSPEELTWLQSNALQPWVVWSFWPLFWKRKRERKKKISFLRGAECFHSAILNLLWIIYIRGKEREGKVRRARLNHKLLGSGCDSGHVGVGCGYYNQWQGDMCPLRHSGHVMARSPITNDNVGFLYPTIQKEQSFVGFITIMLWLLHNWEKLMIK